MDGGLGCGVFQDAMPSDGPGFRVRWLEIKLGQWAHPAVSLSYGPGTWSVT